MEIKGTFYGMAPIDSPQSLIEYVVFNKNIEGETIIELDAIYKEMVSEYAVFSSNPDIKVIEKTKDSFKVQGTGITDFEIKGQRKDGQKYFVIMGGIEHGITEEQTS